MEKVNRFLDQYHVEIGVTVLADPRSIRLDGQVFVGQDGAEYTPAVVWERYDAKKGVRHIDRLNLEAEGLSTGLYCSHEVQLQAIAKPDKYICKLWGVSALPDQVYTSDGVELVQKALPDGTVIYYGEIVNGEVIDHISYGLDDLADRLQESPNDFAIKEPKRCAIPFTGTGTMSHKNIR